MVHMTIKLLEFEIYQYLSMCVCHNHSGVCVYVLTQHKMCELWHFSSSWISQAFPVWRDESGEGQNLLLCSLATERRKCRWLELSLVLEFTSCHSREPRLLMAYQEYNHITVTLHHSRATIPMSEHSCSHHVVDIHQHLACSVEVNV